MLDISFGLDASSNNHGIISDASLYHELSSGENEVSLGISCDIHLASGSVEIIGGILFYAHSIASTDGSIGEKRTRNENQGESQSGDIFFHSMKVKDRMRSAS